MKNNMKIVNFIYKSLSLIAFILSSHPISYILQSLGLHIILAVFLSVVINILISIIPYINVPTSLFFFTYAFIDCFIKNGMFDAETIYLFIILMLWRNIVILRGGDPFLLLFY